VVRTRARGVSARSGRRALRARRAPLGGAPAAVGSLPFQREGAPPPPGELGKQPIVGDKGVMTGQDLHTKTGAAAGGAGGGRRCARWLLRARPCRRLSGLTCAVGEARGAGPVIPYWGGK